MDSFPGPGNGSEETPEDRKMKEAYEQLERDMKKELWEQRKRMRDEERTKEEWKRMEETRWKMGARELGVEMRSNWNEEWEDEDRQDKDAEWRRHWEEEEEKRKKDALNRSYEKLQTEVKKYVDGMVSGYKEDIDTLLVFAGLFSAIVTAFLIESYQWLQEDPKDTTVVILTQIFHQLNASSIQEPEPFTPDASSIRINCFWFLSLIFSLTSALFGLLCKQWLQEHQRDVPTRTPGEDLALRKLRRDSFEKWGVVSFLSALPILLEIAVILFFVGVLDFLWTLQPIVFSICLAAISLSVGLYFLTTILPTITIPHDQARFISTWDSELDRYCHDFGQLAYQFICPYKSPQAFAVYKLVTILPKPLMNIPFINKFIKTYLRPLWDHITAQSSSWSTFDLRVVRQFDQEVYLDVVPRQTFRLQVYELQALQWAVTMFRDSPSMIPDLENVLQALPHSVAFSVALDRWDIAMWEGWERDIGEYLRYPTRFPLMPKPITSASPLHSRDGIELLFWHQLWGVFAGNGSVDLLTSSLEEFTQKFPKSSMNLQFFIPLPIATALWTHKEPWVQQRSLRLLRYFEDSWKPCPGYDEERHNEERVAFANALAEHIRRSYPPSVLLTSQRGQKFIRFIHNDIIVRQLYSYRLAEGRAWWGWGWQDAIQKVQEVGKLPNDYFAPLPRWDEDLPCTFQPPQLEAIRYSVDTVHPQSNDPFDEEKESSLSHPPVDNVDESIEIQVHRSQLDITGEFQNPAGDTLIPGSANQGGIGYHAVDEDSALLLDNDEPRTVVEGTNLSPDDSGAQAVESASAAHVVALSAGDDEPTLLREATPPDTDPDRPTQPNEDAARNIDSPLEEGKRVRDDHEEQATVGSQGTADHSFSQDQGEYREQRRDGGRGWNVVNDPDRLRMHWFRS
ncbi:hypothetical protein VNI00_014234 [Paramarasmius palmivorus]|uniref:DUF6535 domain-containing protein n=1 Tax=Paramarasmius palmivorus TaxID=297713 RepID=A0AAW0BU97_9AGAR